MIEIIGSQTSPFVRMVRTACEDLGLEYELIQTSFYKKMNEDDHKIINAENPLMRVPVLKDSGHTIIDSRVIMSYLREHYETEPVFENAYDHQMDAENILSVIYGIIDAGVLRFIMASEGVNPEGGYLARSKERILAGLKFLDRQDKLGQAYGVPELALVCALEWFKKRDIVDWSGYENIVKAYEKYKDRTGLVKTRIPAEA